MWRWWIVFAAAVRYVPHLYQQLHDWLFMAGLVILFAIPSAVAGIRRHVWRRRVMSAFR
jgi:hypothetical protein